MKHLCRYEFLDAVLRVVEAKYDLDHAPPDSHSREDHILESVERFRDEHLAKLPAAAHECVDAFRRDTLYCEEVDIVLCCHDRVLKQIWAAYGNAHRKAGHARFTADVFGEFLTKCLLCHSADTIQAARRSFAFGRTFFVDTCDAGFRECPVPLTVRGTQALVGFAPLAPSVFCAARQNAVLRRSPLRPT